MQKLFGELTGVLGLLYARKDEDAIPDEVLALVEERKAARKEKNFAKADELRAQIEALGYDVKETRQGTQITKK
jgi:cysteinyl-tRNA synthetase